LLIVVWLHVWILYSVPLVFMSVFVPVPCCFPFQLSGYHFHQIYEEQKEDVTSNILKIMWLCSSHL
jgi:hypothetical protein